jgi:hypothetical protein
MNPYKNNISANSELQIAMNDNEKDETTNGFFKKLFLMLMHNKK